MSSDPAAAQRLADLARLRRVRDRMDREYAQPLDVPALARVALMSEAHFIREFRATFGETPHRYLQRRRVERAMFLLTQTDLPIMEVCLDVGFTSLGTFGRTFRDITGERPSDLRAREQAGTHALDRVPHCFVRAAQRPDLKTAVSEKRRREADDNEDGDAIE